MTILRRKMKMSMNNFRKLSFGELCDRICENKRTLIVFHVHADADAVGSAFALREILTGMGIPAICACAEEVPQRLQFIVDGVQGSVLISPDMSVDHERVISVDAAAPKQLGNLFDSLHRDIDIMIDHHSAGTVYADCYIDSGAAATSEIILAIAGELRRRGALGQVSMRTMNCIYAGISSDTGGFRFANVTPATHRAAAALIEAGVDSASINHKLFECKSPRQVRAEGEAIKRLKTYDKGRFACVSIPYPIKKLYQLEEEDMDTVIDIPRSINGVEVAFSIRQPGPENFFRVSMRSSTDFDVSRVCSGFGGGGHVRAAGCSLEADSIESAERMIIAAVRSFEGER